MKAPARNTDKPTLTQQILALLSDGEWHSSYEIHTSVSASGSKLPYCTSARTRISDLRKEGHTIQVKHEGSNAFYYRLIKPMEQTQLAL